MYAPFPASVEYQLTESIKAYNGMDKAVVAVGFDPAACDDIERAVIAAGARLLASDPGAVRIADIAIINLTDAAAPVDAACVNGHVILCVPMTALDDAVASWPDAEIIIGADPVELHLAIASAVNRAGGIVHRAFDGTSNEGLRLQRLADEISRIARSLVDLPEGSSATNGHGRAGLVHDDRPVVDTPASNRPVTAGEVRAVIRLRRLRDRYFPADLFADPAWDMLLDLAAARLERVRVAVSSLCIAAAVPPTTALRWIKAMTDKGLLLRIADPHDARRIFIQLSDDSAKAMEAYLHAARNGGGGAI